MIRLNSKASTAQGLLDDIAEEIDWRISHLIEMAKGGLLDHKAASFAAWQLTILATDIKMMECGPIEACDRVSRPLSSKEDRDLWERANPGYKCPR